MTASAHDRCEYLRTAIAVALWKRRGEQDKVEQLRGDCDDRRHLLVDQSALANAMISAIAGHNQCGATTNMAELAAGMGVQHTSQAHLANAVLAWPELAWHFDDFCAVGASEPLAWLTCSLAAHLGRGEQGAEQLLASLAAAPTAEAVARLLERAAAGQ